MQDRDELRRELRALTAPLPQPKQGVEPPGRVKAISKDGEWALVVLDAFSRCWDCGRVLQRGQVVVFDGHTTRCKRCGPARETVRFTLTPYGVQRRAGYIGLAAKNRARKLSSRD